MLRNGWPDCPGMGGRNQSEWVAGMGRNTHKMDKGLFDVEEVKAYWFTEAQEARQVAEHLVEKGDYSYALFFGHLAVEKLLKALYVARRGEHAPSGPQFAQAGHSCRT